MSTFIKIFLILFGFNYSQTFGQSPVSKRPNIIVIFADDLGYGELGCYGQQIIKTPHIDKMAREGLKFTDFYSSSALCAPARCQLLTGLHSGHAPVRANFEMAGGPDSFTDLNEKGQMPLPPGTVTIAERLKESGYSTACVGKWGLGMADTPGNPNDHGFDYFFGYLDQKQAHNYYPTHLWENGKRYNLNNPFIRVHTKVNSIQASDSLFNSFVGNEYSIDVMANKAEDFIRANKSEPFFLYYAITLPHLALQVPPQALKEYEGKFEEQPYLGDKNYCPVKYPRATYAAMVSYLDRKTGELLQLLKELGIDSNTLVIFTSDNGSAFPVGGTDPEFFKVNQPLRAFKGDLYEGGIRIPFIAHWPGYIKPGIDQTPLAGYDLFSTLSEVAGARNSSNDGISFVPLLKGRKLSGKGHDFLYFELYEYGGQQAVRMGKWKAIRRDMLKNADAQWELYDLSKDISEKNNLAMKHPMIVRKAQKIAESQHSHAAIDQWNFMER
ncbi:MAG: arylsulfatase [Cyclobacteriaceae bacterium]